MPLDHALKDLSESVALELERKVLTGLLTNGTTTSTGESRINAAARQRLIRIFPTGHSGRVSLLDCTP
jgi:hypothetical protein